MKQSDKISDKEYLSLLQEIDEETATLEDLEDNIELEHSTNLCEESDSNSNKANLGNCYSREYMAQLSVKGWMASAQARKERARQKRESILDLKRRILMADNLPFSIYDEVPDEELRQLILMLTEERWRVAEKYRAFIDKRISRYMEILTPLNLRRAYALYPQAFVAHPGFLYKVASEDGRGLAIWVTPTNVPYYLPQFTENEALRERFKLSPVDYAVQRFYAIRSEIVKKEIEYATKLRRVKTYQHLLNINPVWLVKIKPELEKLP